MLFFLTMIQKAFSMPVDMLETNYYPHTKGQEPSKPCNFIRSKAFVICSTHSDVIGEHLIKWVSCSGNKCFSLNNLSERGVLLRSYVCWTNKLITVLERKVSLLIFLVYIFFRKHLWAILFCFIYLDCYRFKGWRFR